MSDAKTDYSNTVKFQKDASANDVNLANQIKYSYERKAQYGENWETVDINDVVSIIAPGSKPIFNGKKIIYYNSDKTKAVVADLSGYLRVEDYTKKTNKKQYLDKLGNDAHNYVDSKGKKHGRSRPEFEKATHYIIKKRT